MTWPGRPKTYDEVEAESDAANRRALDAGAKRFRESGEWDAIRFDCFNREEARKAKDYAMTKHPDVKWHFTWIAGGTESHP